MLEVIDIINEGLLAHKYILLRRPASLMVVPILYLIAAQLYRGRSPERPLIWCAHASTLVMLVRVRTVRFGRLW